MNFDLKIEKMSKAMESSLKGCHLRQSLGLGEAYPMTPKIENINKIKILIKIISSRGDSETPGQGVYRASLGASRASRASV